MTDENESLRSNEKYAGFGEIIKKLEQARKLINEAAAGAQKLHDEEFATQIGNLGSSTDDLISHSKEQMADQTPISERHPEEPVKNETHENLDNIDIVTPISFMGKIYRGQYATDFNYTGRLFAQLGSGSYMDRIQSKIKPKPLDSDRPRVFLLCNNGNNAVQINAVWRTEGDLAMSLGLNLIQARVCVGAEYRSITKEVKDKLIDLMRKGYNPLSKFASTDNIAWVYNKQGNIVPFNVNDRNIEISSTGGYGKIASGKETITLDGKEKSLWDDEKWTNQDKSIAFIAAIYLKLTKGESVEAIKDFSDSYFEGVLIAQAVNQMLISEGHEILLQWKTENDAEVEGQTNLSFVDRNDRFLKYYKNVVYPEKIVITPEIQGVMDDIKASFKNPLTEALQIWKKLRLNRNL